MCRLFLGDVVEHIALILAVIRGAQELKALFLPIVGHPGIMTCCHVVKSLLDGIGKHLSEFQLFVAHYTGIRGDAPDIVRCKGAAYIFGKAFGKVSSDMLYTQSVAYCLCVRYPGKTAALCAGELLTEQPHGAACDLISLLHQ